MQNKINSIASSPTRIVIANVALDKAEAAPPNGRHAMFNLLEIRAVPGGEIIESHNVLVEFQQSTAEDCCQ